VGGQVKNEFCERKLSNGSGSVLYVNESLEILIRIVV